MLCESSNGVHFERKELLKENIFELLVSMAEENDYRKLKSELQKPKA
jgi:hypothetical protein